MPTLRIVFFAVCFISPFVSQNTYAQQVLFVTGNEALSSADDAVKRDLDSLGMSVHVVSDAVSATSDSNGKDLILLSESVSSRKVGRKFSLVAVPLVVYESYLYDDLGMSKNMFRGLGNERAQKSIVMQGTHPLSDGQRGAVQVASSSASFSWARPGREAIVAATLSGDSSRAVIFGYEKGARLANGKKAPARRVGLYPHVGAIDSRTAAGRDLFLAAIQWALSNSSDNESLAALDQPTEPTIDILPEPVDWPAAAETPQPVVEPTDESVPVVDLEPTDANPSDTQDELADVDLTVPVGEAFDESAPEAELDPTDASPSEAESEMTDASPSEAESEMTDASPSEAEGEMTDAGPSVPVNPPANENPPTTDTPAPPSIPQSSETQSPIEQVNVAPQITDTSYQCNPVVELVAYEIGQTDFFTLSVTDESLLTLNYSADSSNVDVASVTVDGNGVFKVTALSVGESYLWLSAEDENGLADEFELRILVE